MWDIIGFLVFGLFVGAIARLLTPGKQGLGLIWTMLLGVAGSLIGGFIAKFLGSGDYFELNVLGGVIAIVAAMLLIGVAEAGARSTTKSHRTAPRG